MKNLTRILLVMIILGLIAAFFIFDLKQYLSLSYIKGQQQAFADFYTQNPVATIGGYMLIYIVTTALSLPGAALLTLLGGALFGVLTGTIVVSFASTIGATCAFLASRFLLREYVQSKFGKYLSKVNQGVEQEGAFYLFTLRLIPAFPFFVINLVMGLTPMRTMTYFLVSQVGMLPGTIVYVNAGTQLSQIDSLKGIVSPGVLGSFVLLGLFPLITKKVMGMIGKNKGTPKNA